MDALPIWCSTPRFPPLLDALQIQVPKTVLRVNTCCVGYSPQRGWLMGVRSDGVRHLCPGRAPYSRHVRPHVVGLPHRRVLCVIRHPSGLRWAFPVTGLLPLPAEQESLGRPTFFDASLPACHGLRTPADLPILADTAGLGWPSGAFKPSASALAISKRYQHFRGRGHPYGRQDVLSTLRPCRVHRVPHGSAMDARLDTGGRLPLTRPGLSPGQRRQAFLAR
jgi:hypothetical protein